MKSNICIIRENGEGQKEALAETRKVAVYTELSKKQALQLKLLAEELTGFMKEIAYDCVMGFQIQEENRQFRLILTTDELLDWETRKQLIAASSTRKNDASRGIMGKIRAAFEYCLTADAGMVPPPMADCSAMGFSPMTAGTTWSIDTYRANLAENRRKHREEWDELEKSILANLADHVTVSASSDRVEIIVTKSFQHDLAESQSV